MTAADVIEALSKVDGDTPVRIITLHNEHELGGLLDMTHMENIPDDMSDVIDEAVIIWTDL